MNRASAFLARLRQGKNSPPGMRRALRLMDAGVVIMFGVVVVETHAFGAVLAIAIGYIAFSAGVGLALAALGSAIRRFELDVQSFRYVQDRHADSIQKLTEIETVRRRHVEIILSATKERVALEQRVGRA